MSTLSLLPLIQVRDGVQIDEDWRLAIAFYLDDAVTPVNLTGLTFALSVGSFANLSTASGQITVSGPSRNVMNIVALAENKAAWPVGVHDLALTASDGASTRDIFAYSTLSVGGPQAPQISLLVAPDVVPRSIASPLPAALAQAMQGVQPQNLASALAGLPASQLAGVAQAIFSALPLQSGPSAPVGSGQAFVNVSGYVVIAQ